MDWTITHGNQIAAINEVGGGLRTYRVEGVDVVDGYPEASRPPGGAGQILAPWPNRVRDGRYEFEGRTHELALTEPEHNNAIHGLVRRLSWQLTAKRDNQVTVECVINDEPGYPFVVRLSTTWSLSGDGLQVEHEAEGLGPGAAPFGLGVHPYLTIPGATADDLALTVPADQVLYDDERGLPTEQAEVAATEFDFRAERAIGAAVIDHAFTALFDRRVRISSGAGAVEVWLDAAFPWVQVFTGDTLDRPRYRRSVAVEPMTCPADAFNSGTDLITLEAGQVWRGAWGIRRFS
jgi:aldose 1-epimerase